MPLTYKKQPTKRRHPGQTDYHFTRIDTLKTYEGLSLSRYRCLLGRLTIGWGHTSEYVSELGEGVAALPRVITELEAEAFLLRDIANLERALAAIIEVPVSQAQFNALLIFAFNIGMGAFVDSNLLKYLNQGFHEKAGCEFLKWNQDANGKPCVDLLKRREAERRIYYSQTFIFV